MASKRSDADARTYRRHGCMQFYCTFEVTWKANEKSPASKTLTAERACSQATQRYQVRRHAVPCSQAAVESSIVLFTIGPNPDL